LLAFFPLPPDHFSIFIFSAKGEPMKKAFLHPILGAFFLLSLALLGSGCGSSCGEGETEVCSDFQTFEKNGDFGDGCICVQEECSIDEDCPAGFVCDDGLCVGA
jgi:hypothetical protein